MLAAIFNPPKNKFEKYWFFDLIKMVLWNWYIYIFYVLLKIYVFFYNFYQKLKIFIKKQRRYEFLKIIVFWLNGLKILRHEGPTVHCSRDGLLCAGLHPGDWHSIPVGLPEPGVHHSVTVERPDGHRLQVDGFPHLWEPLRHGLSRQCGDMLWVCGGLSARPHASALHGGGQGEEEWTVVE